MQSLPQPSSAGPSKSIQPSQTASPWRMRLNPVPLGSVPGVTGHLIKDTNIIYHNENAERFRQSYYLAVRDQLNLEFIEQLYSVTVS